MKKKNFGSRRKQKDKSTKENRELESCLPESDLLSLAQSRTKFTSFHDRAKASFSVLLSGQNTQTLDR